MELTAESYRVSAAFPRAEQFGLTIQPRRAAVSVSANIAEGNGRMSTKEYLQFLSHSRGSLNELETLLELSTMLGYVTSADIQNANDLADEVGRMITVLRRQLRAKIESDDGPDDLSG